MKDFKKGDSVLVPDPVLGTDDYWHHEFTGTIKRIAYNIDNDTEYAVVEDQDGDCFDVEVNRLQKEN